MAAAEQIKALIKSYTEKNDERFFSIAMQIAAHEAKQGHLKFAKELRTLIDNARNRIGSSIMETKQVSLHSPKGDLTGLLDVKYPEFKLNNMVLNGTLREELSNVVNEYRKVDILAKFNLAPTRKLLLTGAPGTGKTMTALALGGELGLPVFTVRLDGLISKFMGEAIAKLRLIFDSMSQVRGIYLFDEFDSIGSSRGNANDVGEIKRVLNSFLVNIENDSSNSLIISATNFPEALDPALYRRFDRILKYPKPTKEEIATYIEYKLKSFGLKWSKSLNFTKLSVVASGLSYAELEMSCSNAAKETILNNKKTITLSSLEAQLRLTKDRTNF